MNIASLVFNPVQENTYILWDSTNECVIVDAGNSTDRENTALENFIKERGLKPVMAINTHGHFDHAMGVEFVRRRFDVPFAMSSKDNYLLESAKEGSVIYGMRIGAMPTTIDIDLDTTEELSFGETTLKVIKTPGHTPGHISLYDAKSKVLLTGDTLFRESIGRTDLPGGDYVSLMNSITKVIIPLGDEVAVYPGHSEETTIGHECLYNPFVVEVISGEIKY
ncbi:MAG: MBL fold metallo-hydrolase [Rikenellaceae bacterium]